MAIESKRGCGFRKIGGLYMVGGNAFVSCDRLPFELDVCPCCGEGIKQSRGWTWVQPYKMLEGDHNERCGCKNGCPVCFPSIHFGEDGKAGLLWIGKQYYQTPEDFMREAVRQGISRKIHSIPRDFKPGETWIFLAHPIAVKKEEKVFALAANGKRKRLLNVEIEYAPGIFTAFKPERIERLVKQSEYEEYLLWKDGEGEESKVTKKFDSDERRGISFVPVPDDDPEHQ